MQPSVKKLRVEQSPGIQGLPHVILSMIWSFIHLLDAPNMVPDKVDRNVPSIALLPLREANLKASREAQRRLNRFTLDERWMQELNRPHNVRREQAWTELVCSRFNPDNVSCITLDLQGTKYRLEPFLTPLIRFLERVTMASVTGSDSGNYSVATALASSPRLVHFELFVTATHKNISQEWARVLASLRSPDCTELATAFTAQSIFLVCSPRVLSQLQWLHIPYRADDDLQPLLTVTTKLVSLELNMQSPCDNEAAFCRLATTLSTWAPQLESVNVAFSESMPYVSAKTLCSFLALRQLSYFWIGLDHGVTWERKKNAEYDNFLRAAVDAWPRLTDLGVGLPVSDEFWTSDLAHHGHKLLVDIHKLSEYDHTAIAAWKVRHPWCKLV